MKLVVTIELETGHLQSYTDEHLGNLYGAVNASTEPDNFELARLGDSIRAEMVRRWLKDRPASPYGRSEKDYWFAKQLDLKEELKQAGGAGV